MIALIDSSSPSHQAANQWLDSQRGIGWTTCPITENGLVRIITNPNFQSGPVTIEQAIEALVVLKEVEGHRFIPDDVSLADVPEFRKLTGSKQITDLYLVVLARHHSMKLATFDSKMKYLPKACQPYIVYL